MSVYNAIGLMSGTSLDGLDIAYCVFTKQAGQWRYKLVKALTIEYSETWQERLRNSMQLSAEGLRKLDMDYGALLGRLTRRFIESNHLRVDLVASHGHTVFHQPEQAYTLQIGAGAALAAELDVPVVFDFRSQDVALGGQGAPLVPVGDELLFGDYAACVNIGGFANISMQDANANRIAWDICPVNFVLNPLAQRLGLAYDQGGEQARQGKVLPNLLEYLNALPYYEKAAPKSLGAEWVEDEMRTRLEGENEKDLLATLSQHAVQQIANNLPGHGRVLFTGGGTKNTFLMELIKAQSTAEVVVPDALMVDFKEALIFAFLGTLRMCNENNVWASVTGASRNHCAGSLIG